MKAFKNCFRPAEIALPDFNKTAGEKWAVVACDQFTSEPEYWENADRIAGDEPSVLRLILPEVYLNRVEERVPLIHAKMKHYLQNVLKIHKNSMIYLERVQSDGKVRKGLVGMVDLEAYNYFPGSDTPVRATEGTVLERIPPRQAVRRGGALETPHIMLLIDDPGKTVIEPLAAEKNAFETAYDFDLMLGGGHVTGYFVPEKLFAAIDERIGALVSPEALLEKYGEATVHPLLYAVGDGNHSLATAKACYEEIKAKIGAAALNHPARYALCEVVNLHDDALQFEPIYRAVFNVSPCELLLDFKAYAASRHGTAAPQTLEFISGETRETVTVRTPEKQLPVGTLQAFLDEWLAGHPGAHADYIHNVDSLEKLAGKPDSAGFLFEGMSKQQLFNTVMHDGVLPRKTFSMGHAQDKRYCLECRVILRQEEI